MGSLLLECFQRLLSIEVSPHANCLAVPDGPQVGDSQVDLHTTSFPAGTLARKDEDLVPAVAHLFRVYAVVVPFLSEPLEVTAEGIPPSIDPLLGVLRILVKLEVLVDRREGCLDVASVQAS
jgi:hypothetical protein